MTNEERPKPKWYERGIPTHWNSDEALFLGNWLGEMAKLHKVLMSVAPDQPKLLRRAREFHFRLAGQLKQRIEKTAAQANQPTPKQKARTPR